MLFIGIYYIYIYINYNLYIIMCEHYFFEHLSHVMSFAEMFQSETKLPVLKSLFLSPLDFSKLIMNFVYLQMD